MSEGDQHTFHYQEIDTVEGVFQMGGAITSRYSFLIHICILYLVPTVLCMWLVKVQILTLPPEGTALYVLWLFCM